MNGLYIGARSALTTCSIPLLAVNTQTTATAGLQEYQLAEPDSDAETDGEKLEGEHPPPRHATDLDHSDGNWKPHKCSTKLPPSSTPDSSGCKTAF